MVRLLANRSRRASEPRRTATEHAMVRLAWFVLLGSCSTFGFISSVAIADEAAKGIAPTNTGHALVPPVGNANPANATARESRLIRAKFSDGTILIGELLLDELEVETSFGKLVVPHAQLLGISPGLDSRAHLDDRLDSWVADLLSSDQARIAIAERELMRLGAAAAEELARRAAKLQGEPAQRLAALVERMRESENSGELADGDAAGPLIRKDRVRTTKFTIVGRIVDSELRFRCRYGELTVAIGDIVAVERQVGGGREDISKSLVVTGQNLAQTQMKRSGVSVRKGDRIVVKASGMIKRTAATSSYVSSPDGSPRFGTHPTNHEILGGTLIAKIGSGTDVKVGSNAAFVAQEDGELSFGVAMRQEYVGRYPFPGEYQVRLRVQRGD